MLRATLCGGDISNQSAVDVSRGDVDFDAPPLDLVLQAHLGRPARVAVQLRRINASDAHFLDVVVVVLISPADAIDIKLECVAINHAQHVTKYPIHETISPEGCDA